MYFVWFCFISVRLTKMTHFLKCDVSNFFQNKPVFFQASEWKNQGWFFLLFLFALLIQKLSRETWLEQNCCYAHKFNGQFFSCVFVACLKNHLTGEILQEILGKTDVRNGNYLSCNYSKIFLAVKLHLFRHTLDEIRFFIYV